MNVEKLRRANSFTFSCENPPDPYILMLIGATARALLHDGDLANADLRGSERVQSDIYDSEICQ